MNEKVKQILDYVVKMEDFYYGLLTGGKNIYADCINSAQATSFQMTRYFIESLYDKESEDTK